MIFSHGGNMRYMRILFAFLFTAFIAHAQWPTSTRTDSALSINYGFEVNAVTFDNGSVIFSHGYSRYQFLTKFDGAGYTPWFNPVLINNHDSANGGNWPMISNGAGGIIMILGDRRGATYDSMGIARTNPIWMQHVDSNGTERWGTGVRVAPADGSAKFAWITSDGAGGAILVTLESSWAFPGALNYSRMRARRANRNVQVLWVRTLDSSADIRLHIYVDHVRRAGRFIYIDGMRYFQQGRETYLTRIIDTSGNVPMYSPWLQYHSNEVFQDSVLFTFTPANRVTKIGPEGNTVWNITVPAPQDSCRGMSAWKILVPDERGGVFYLLACNDSLYHINAIGQLSRLKFAGTSNPRLSRNTIGVFSDGNGGLVWADISGLAQRYDSLGRPLWGASPIVYRSDPENADFEAYWGDNNGGIIATFWSPSRGLCAQHTGRYGRVGVVPVIQLPPLPEEFSLSQNYPNPFNPSTRIKYIVPTRSQVTIDIYDLLGKHIDQLVNGLKEPGSHEIDWKAGDVASGVYIYRMKSGERIVAVKKMMLIR